MYERMDEPAPPSLAFVGAVHHAATWARAVPITTVFGTPRTYHPQPPFSTAYLFQNPVPYSSFQNSPPLTSFRTIESMNPSTLIE